MQSWNGIADFSPRGTVSPAPAQSAKPTSLPAPARGKLPFARDCACHGCDAAGGESGPELTRSQSNTAIGNMKPLSTKKILCAAAVLFFFPARLLSHERALSAEQPVSQPMDQRTDLERPSGCRSGSARRLRRPTLSGRFREHCVVWFLLVSALGSALPSRDQRRVPMNVVVFLNARTPPCVRVLATRSWEL